MYKLYKIWYKYKYQTGLLFKTGRKYQFFIIITDTGVRILKSLIKDKIIIEEYTQYKLDKSISQYLDAGQTLGITKSAKKQLLTIRKELKAKKQ